MKPDISIIVPTRNAGPDFPQLFEKLSTQRGNLKPEIVVIDSGSSDGTPECARRRGAKVVEIPPETFDHGLTRNLGIQEAHGEFCVLLVQDALPVHDCWLEALVRHFNRDPLICGVTTRQVPRPETDIVARWEVEHHNKLLGNEARVRLVSDWDAFLRVPLQDRFFMCNFDNVCSALRRSVWEKHGFRSSPFAEDLDWAVRVLRAGYKIAYEPEAVVLHSHVRPAIYHLRRQYISAKIVPRILQCPVPRHFAANDREIFAAINSLMQEAFSLLLLVDQRDSSMSPAEWHRWLRLAESCGLDNLDGGSQSVKALTYSYARRLGRRLPLPRPLVSSLRSRVRASLKSVQHNPMRDHFFFLLSEVVEGVSELTAATFRHTVVHCLARTLGGFLGSYYLWCEEQGTVSSELRLLDQLLCNGV